MPRRLSAKAGQPAGELQPLGLHDDLRALVGKWSWIFPTLRKAPDLQVSSRITSLEDDFAARLSPNGRVRRPHHGCCSNERSGVARRSPAQQQFAESAPRHLCSYGRCLTRPCRLSDRPASPADPRPSFRHKPTAVLFRKTKSLPAFRAAMVLRCSHGGTAERHSRNWSSISWRVSTTQHSASRTFPKTVNHLVRARQPTVCIADKMTTVSLPRWDGIGGRDHHFASYGIRKMQSGLSTRTNWPEGFAEITQSMPTEPTMTNPVAALQRGQGDTDSFVSAEDAKRDKRHHAEPSDQGN